MVLPIFTMVLLGFTIVLLQDVQYLRRCQVSPQRNRPARRENHGRLLRETQPLNRMGFFSKNDNYNIVKNIILL